MTDRPGPELPTVDVRAPRRRQVLALLTGLVFTLAGVVLATGPLLPAVVGVLSILFFARSRSTSW